MHDCNINKTLLKKKVNHIYILFYNKQVYYGTRTHVVHYRVHILESVPSSIARTILNYTVANTMPLNYPIWEFYYALQRVHLSWISVKYTPDANNKQRNTPIHST